MMLLMDLLLLLLLLPLVMVVAIALGRARCTPSRRLRNARRHEYLVVTIVIAPHHTILSAVLTSHASNGIVGRGVHPWHAQNLVGIVAIHAGAIRIAANGVGVAMIR